MNYKNIWKLTATKTEVAAAIPSERVHALTISTRVPNDGFGSSAKSLEPDTGLFRKRGYRSYRKRGCFVSSPRSVLDRLKAALIEFASIAILVAGFVMAALFALDLMDMLKW